MSSAKLITGSLDNFGGKSIKYLIVIAVPWTHDNKKQNQYHNAISRALANLPLCNDLLWDLSTSLPCNGHNRVYLVVLIVL